MYIYFSGYLWGQETLFLQSACTSTLTLRGLLLQPVPLLAHWWTDVTVEALVHLLTDDVHQPVEDLLHVDVVFSTGLKKLEACGARGEKRHLKWTNWFGFSCRQRVWAPTQFRGYSLAILRRDLSVLFQVQLIPHQNHLSAVPRVRLDLGCPGNAATSEMDLTFTRSILTHVQFRLTITKTDIWRDLGGR